MRGYFEGWYFKQQSKTGTVALIPAMHMQAGKGRAASLQVVTEEGAYCCPVPWETFRADRRRLKITTGNSTFGPDGIRLDVHSGECTAQGQLHFGPFTPIRYDIMGPFQYIPLMECRHSVFSMAHLVTGRLSINGREYRFEKDLGYIEGDRGSSFPKRYAWTQWVWQEGGFSSIMLSVADIPFLGMSFTGIIGVVYLNGREHRLATYLGAKATHIGQGEVVVRQGEYTLSARRLEENGMLLRAPSNGMMDRQIREAPSCRVHYRFKRGTEILLDKTAGQAGFEYEYDT